MEAYFVTTESR